MLSAMRSVVPQVGQATLKGVAAPWVIRATRAGACKERQASGAGVRLVAHRLARSGVIVAAVGDPGRENR
ncbi:MAG TPA: hypothetical protein VG013_16435, partial [Gemmataceae bacterium]|nr:hypothetical protein [Gemmataceae bacterium]